MRADNSEYRDMSFWNNKENEQYLHESVEALRRYSENEDGNSAFAAFLSSDAFQGEEAEAAKEAVEGKLRELRKLQEAARSAADCMAEIETAFLERMPEKRNAVISEEVLNELCKEFTKDAEEYRESADAVSDTAEFLNSVLSSYGSFTVPHAERVYDAFDELCGWRDAGNRCIIKKTQKRLQDFLEFAEDIYKKYDPDSLLDMAESNEPVMGNTSQGSREISMAVSDAYTDQGEKEYTDWLRVIFDIEIPDESVALGAISLE